MSIALTLQILFMYREGYLYPWLPPTVNHLIVAVISALCLLLHHFHFELEQIAI